LNLPATQASRRYAKVSAMDHPSVRLLARYALADITDEQELADLEDHLMICEDCRRKAVAVDLIGTVPLESNEQEPLHIAMQTIGEQVALCGNAGHRNVITDVLVPGMDAKNLCADCLSLWRSQSGANRLRPN
jgi:hypothetical protein